MALTVVNFYPRIPTGFALKPNSCTVGEVNKTGAAARRGVQPGWIVLSVNDKPVNTRNVKTALTFSVQAPRRLRVQFLVPSNKNKLMLSLQVSGSPGIRVSTDIGFRSSSSSISMLNRSFSEEKGTDLFNFDALPSLSTKSVSGKDDHSNGYQSRESVPDHGEGRKSRKSKPVEWCDQLNLETPTPKWDCVRSNSSRKSEADSIYELRGHTQNNSMATVIYRTLTEDSLLSASAIDFDGEAFSSAGPSVFRNFDELEDNGSTGEIPYLMKSYHDDLIGTVSSQSLESISETHCGIGTKLVKPHWDQSLASLPTLDANPETSSIEESSSDEDEESDDGEFDYIKSLIRGIPMLPKGCTSSKPKAKSSSMIVPMGHTDNVCKSNDKEITTDTKSCGKVNKNTKAVASFEHSEHKEAYATAIEIVAASSESTVESDQDTEEEGSEEESSGTGEDEDDGFEYFRSLIKGEQMIPKGYTTGKPKKKSSAIIVPIVHSSNNLLTVGKKETLEKKSDSQINEEKKEDIKIDHESKSDSEEESSQEESSEESSEDDNQFSYIKSLIKGAPMIPAGFTTSKPKKKSSALLIPNGYSKEGAEEVLRAESQSNLTNKRNISNNRLSVQSVRLSRSTTPFKGSPEKPKYLEVPSSRAAYGGVNTVVIHNSTGDSSSFEEDSYSSEESSEDEKFGYIKALIFGDSVKPNGTLNPNKNTKIIPNSNSYVQERTSERVSNSLQISTPLGRLGSLIVDEEVLSVARKMKSESLPVIKEPSSPVQYTPSGSRSVNSEEYTSDRSPKIAAGVLNQLRPLQNGSKDIHQVTTIEKQQSTYSVKKVS